MLSHCNLHFPRFVCSTAQWIPAETYHAKTVFIRNNAGGAPLENARTKN